MEGTTQNIDLPKKHKKRNKKLLKHLQDQIDFYFSDASLSKDRFLKQEISKNPDGYVEIQVIANFNRMKQMTEDINLVVKAMKNSSIVEVSSDKKLVRRIAALPGERNVDAQTIYVEKLPSYADHNWLTTVFSTFGKVDYVSIPRYKGTGDIKGFAFIEFQTEEDAKNALKAFNTRMEEEKEECNDEEQSEETEAPKDRKKRKRTASETETENDSQELKIERKRKKMCERIRC